MVVTGEALVTLAELVEILAVQLPGRDVPGQPMLAQLRVAVFGGSGEKVPGAGQPWKVPLNVGAAIEWEQVAEEAAVTYAAATDLPPFESPQANLLAWWAVFSAARARDEITDMQIMVAQERLTGWVDRIRRVVDPPRTSELALACPECGAAHVLTPDGDGLIRQAAVVVEVRPAESLRAFCRNPSCGSVWPGDEQVIRLAKAAGVDVNADLVREALTPTTNDLAGVS